MAPGPANMVQKHVSILAKTGGGKSFLCGDLIEELMKHDVTVMVLDPHGEYGAMRDVGHVGKGHRDFKVTARGFEEHIIEFATDTNVNKNAKPLRFTLANIEAHDLLSLTSIKNGKAYLSALRKAIDAIKSVKKEYTLRDIIKVLESDEEGNNAALVNELQFLEDCKIFAPSGTRIDELVVKGKMTIINLKGTEPEIAELIVNRICTALFELRKLGKVPPMMLVVEEAHNYCPQQGLAASSKIFRTIAAEGRKFGLGLTIISQRAAKIDKNVLSQCNTQMILKVTNPNDLKAITASVEGLTAGMMVLWRSVWPRTISTLVPNSSESSSTTASLARPSVGSAVTFTTRRFLQASTSPTWAFLALGVTMMSSSTPPFTGRRTSDASMLPHGGRTVKRFCITQRRCSFRSSRGSMPADVWPEEGRGAGKKRSWCSAPGNENQERTAYAHIRMTDWT